MSYLSKISDLENTPAKAHIRSDIIDQIIQYTNQTQQKDLEIASLPAFGWIFEDLLQDRYEQSPFVENHPSIQFHCAEKNKHVLWNGLQNRPISCTITNTTIEELVSKPVLFFHDKELLQCDTVGVMDWQNGTRINPTVIWADYCMQPTYKKISYAVRSFFSKKTKTGLYYFTYCLSRVAGGQRSIGSKLGSSSSLPETAIKNLIMQKMRKETNLPVSCIYNVLYRGGKYGKTDMVTLGFLVGNEKISEISECRIEQEFPYLVEDRKQIINKIEQLGIFKRSKKSRNTTSETSANTTCFIKRRGRPSRLTTIDKNQIADMFCKMAKSGKTRKENIIVVTNHYNENNHKNFSPKQVSAVISWRMSEKLQAIHRKSLGLAA